MTIGIIGGSGLYDLDGIKTIQHKAIDTPFGAPSDKYTIASIEGVKIAFLARHGKTHAFAPHKVNYRANIWGFKMLGVKQIISFSAVGAINQKFSIADIVIPNQIIDFSCNSRQSTFFENETVHIDFTEPYCNRLRLLLKQSAQSFSLNLIDNATYICVNGPRLETSREIQYFAQIGADVIGMTGMPEAALAREAEICYANVSIVTNLAAGITSKKLTTGEVTSVMTKIKGDISTLLKNVIISINENHQCHCHNALSGARL